MDTEIEIEIEHGDSMEILRQMNDKCVDHIITDPPYDFDEKTIMAFHEQFLRVARSWVIVFAPPENQWVRSDQYLFWVKPISTKNTSKRYSRFVEMIHVYGSGSWNASRHWSQYTNVFTDLVDDNAMHPYRKPLSMIRRIVLNHTSPGDLLLDPFCGSGSLLEVARTERRSAIGIELDAARYSETKTRLRLGE